MTRGKSSARFLALRRWEDGSVSPLDSFVAIRASPRRLVAIFRSRFHQLTPAGTHHDDDLYLGDVVELFVAPDDADRRIYYEIEVNPAGRIFDARVDSPNLSRNGMRVDRSWNPGGLLVRSRIHYARGKAEASGFWLVRMSLDLSEIAARADRPLAVGAFRIDRRSNGSPLFLALSPGLGGPADFHRPELFVGLRPDP